MSGEISDVRRLKSDFETLEEVKKVFFEQLRRNEIKMKAGDIVKIIELQQKLATSKGAQDQFWELIEQLRQEELKNGK